MNPVSFTNYPATQGEWGTVGSMMLMQFPTTLTGVFGYVKLAAPVNALVNGDVNLTINTSAVQFTNLYSSLRSNNFTDQAGNAFVSSPTPTGLILSNNYSVLINKSVAIAYDSGAMGVMKMGSAKMQ